MNKAIDAEKYYSDLEPHINETVSVLNSIILQMNEPLEGNCFLHGTNESDKSLFLTSWFFIYKRINYVNIIRDFKIKRLLEIGFNAGHSAAVFLSAMEKDATYLAFDLGDHKYSVPCFQFLKSKYPQVSKYIIGDSKETLPIYLEKNPNQLKSFDCVHVDGGHDEETVRSDIELAIQLLRPGGILILDDTQLSHIYEYIPKLHNIGYKFVYQMPTFQLAHICLQKPF